MSIEEQNKHIIEQMHKAVEHRGIVAQADFFAEEVANHGFKGTRDDVRAVLQDILETFPDVSLVPLNLIAEGDWVVGRYIFSGTHTGTGRHPFVHEGLLANVAPTGKKVEVQHIHMFRLKDGLVIEHWANRDDVGMARQLGIPIQ